MGKGLLNDRFEAEAKALDAQDPLKIYADQFIRPAGITYLVGHSLGLRAQAAKQTSFEVEAQWEQLAVEAWFDRQESSSVGPWLDLESKISSSLAPFFGANPVDVTVMSALGVNLVFLLHSFYRRQGRKTKIATFRHMFPQDRWLIANYLKLPGFDPQDLLWIDVRPGEKLLRDDDIIGFLKTQGENISVVVLEAVSYITGQAFDLARIAAEARKQNIILIVDVAHAAFVKPLAFNQWGIDAAVGCSYKFGCSGPGGIGLLYVHERHWNNPNLWRPGGWWGNDRANQFEMGPLWRPAKGAAAWQVSTLPVLAVAPFLGVLKLFEAAGIERIWTKSCNLTDFCFRMLDMIPNGNLHFQILTPRLESAHGSEVAVEFFDRNLAHRLKEWLREHGVLIDYRESPFDVLPNHKSQAGILRAGFHPLFNSHHDVSIFVSLFSQGLSELAAA